MLRIKNSEKFRKDLIRYKAAIQSISNESIKQQYQTMLNKLVEQFNLIDAAHDDVNRNIDPTKIRENVENTIVIRRQLDKLLKDFKSATSVSR